MRNSICKCKQHTIHDPCRPEPDRTFAAFYNCVFRKFDNKQYANTLFGMYKREHELNSKKYLKALKAVQSNNNAV